MGFMRPGCRLNRVSRAFEIKREKGALKKMFKNARHGRLDLGFGDRECIGRPVISKRVRKRAFKIAVEPPRKI